MTNRKLIIIISVLIFLSFFLFYAWRILPSVFGADSGEFLAVMKVLGVAHPPGYPLYTIIGHLLLKIPFGDPAWKVGLFSAFSSSLTLVFLFLSAFTITRSISASLWAIIILGFSYTFGLYSEVVEAFALNNLFASILIFLSVLISTNKIFCKKLIYLFAFIFGLSLTHHHTIILLIPSFLYIFFIKRKLITLKIITLSFTFFLLGLLPYLYLPWAASQLPPHNWGNPSTLNNFLSVIFRSQYGTFQSLRGHFPLMQERILQIPIFGVFLLLDFSLIVIIMFFVGLFSLFKKNRSVFFFLLINFMISGPLFFFYASFPVALNFIVGILERFFLLPSLFFILYVSMGIKISFKFLIEFFKSKKVLSRIHFSPYLLTTVFFSILVFSAFAQNFDRLNFRNVYFMDDFAKDIIRPTEKNSIVFLSGDMALFTAEYVYYNLNYRSDIKLLPLANIEDFYKSTNFRKLYPDLVFPTSLKGINNLALEIIKLNQDKFSIYSITPIGQERWFPTGFLYRYVPDEKAFDDAKLKDKITTSLDSFYDVHLMPVKLKHILFFSEIYETYNLMYLQNANFLLNRNFADEAKKYLDYVSTGSLPPGVKSNLEKLYAIYFFRKNICADSEKHALVYLDTLKGAPSDTGSTYEFLVTIARDCFGDKEKQKHYEELRDSFLKGLETPLNKL